MSLSVIKSFQGVFKGRGLGGSTPPPPRNFQIFLKSEGKEIERKTKKGWEGVVEIFSIGVEIFSGGLRNFRGLKFFREELS